MDVYEIVPLGPPLATRLWVSDRALTVATRFQKKGDPDRTFWKRLLRFAAAGFWLYEGNRSPVRHGGNGVCRVGVV